MRGGWVYIVANRPFGSLYTGVTNNLARRAWEHRSGTVEGFTKRYRLTMLVYAEWHEDIRCAIQRESNIKHWPGAWKIDVISDQNPLWADLNDRVLA
jgi:putative endonuclease